MLLASDVPIGNRQVSVWWKDSTSLPLAHSRNVFGNRQKAPIYDTAEKCMLSFGSTLIEYACSHNWFLAYTSMQKLIVLHSYAMPSYFSREKSAK